MFSQKKKPEIAKRVQQLSSQLEFCQGEIDAFERFLDDVPCRPPLNSPDYLHIQMRLQHAQYVMEQLLATHVKLSELTSDHKKQLKTTREQLMKAARLAGALLEPFGPDEV